MISATDLRQRLTDLAQELEALRSRGLHRIDKRLGTGSPPLPIPLLRTVADDYSDDAQTLTDSERLELLLAEAVSRITDLDMRGRLEIMFGLTSDTRDQFPSTLTERVKTKFGERRAAGTYTRRSREAREKLAEAICRCVAAKEASETAKEADQGHRQLIPRMGLEAEVNRVIDVGAKVIALVGVAGAGKTTLADRLLISSTENKQALWLQIKGDVFYPIDFAGALASQGIDVANVDLSDQQTLFAALICGPNAPRFVVLDGCESTDVLVRLVPHNARSTVVATCRLEGEGSELGHSVIKVGPMTRDEASAMIKSRLPELPDVDVVRLARRLRGHPLTIEHTCRLLAESNLSVSDLLNVLQADPGEVIDSLRTESGESFRAVTNRLLDLVYERDPLALRIMLLASYITSTYFLHGNYAYKFLLPEETSVDRVRFARAVAFLDRFGLIEYDDGIILVHPLTLAVIRSSRRLTRISELAKRAWEVMRRYDKTYSEDYDPNRFALLPHDMQLEIALMRWYSFDLFVLFVAASERDPTIVEGEYVTLRDASMWLAIYLPRHSAMQTAVYGQAIMPQWLEWARSYLAAQKALREAREAIAKLGSDDSGGMTAFFLD